MPPIAKLLWPLLVFLCIFTNLLILFLFVGGVQLVSVTGDSSVIDIWSITAAVTSRTSRAPADSLTSSVSDIIITSDDKLAFASAAGSDEVGIFDMTTSQLVDLMTHEGPVATFSITSNGAYMLVALQHARLGQFNKVSCMIVVNLCLAKMLRLLCICSPSFALCH